MINDCPSFEGCSAPLCPISEELNDCVWYADEAICNARKFTKLHWIRIQKRLKKYNASSDVGYFTRQMLDDRKSCSKHGATKGINPDGQIAKQGFTPKETPISFSQSYNMQLKFTTGGVE